jgi:hypothetical protein
VRYQICRISPRSALRVGCALGWLVALPLALIVAWLAVRLVERVSDTLRGLKEAEVRLPSFELPVVGQVDLGSVPVDVASPLGLDSAAQSASDLAAQLPLVFAGVTLVTMLAGAAVFALGLLLFSLGYNLIARAGAGLEVELERTSETGGGRDSNEAQP